MIPNFIHHFFSKTIPTVFLLSFLATPALASEIVGSIGTGSGNSNPQTVSVVAPTFSPAAGSYGSSQTIALTASGSSSIHYTTNGDTPTCSNGTSGSSPLSASITSTKTIKAVSCYPSNSVSSISTATYTITISSGGGGGGGGGGGAAAPAPAATPVPAVTPVPVVEQKLEVKSTPDSKLSFSDTTPSSKAAPVAVLIHDPSKYTELLAALGVASNPSDFAKFKPLAKSDAIDFKVNLSDDQAKAIANFVTYGASSETVKLGSGERRALVRDYFETVGRGDVVWDDVQRLTTGQKPVKRNLPKEQAAAAVALKNFKKMVGHAPDFKVASEDLAWNTLMYRIRFPRDLAKEKWGITNFKKLMKRAPASPFDWSMVRAMGYALK